LRLSRVVAAEHTGDLQPGIVAVGALKVRSMLRSCRASNGFRCSVISSRFDFFARFSIFAEELSRFVDRPERADNTAKAFFRRKYGRHLMGKLVGPPVSYRPRQLVIDCSSVDSCASHLLGKADGELGNCANVCQGYEVAEVSWCLALVPSHQLHSRKTFGGRNDEAD